LKAVEDRTQGSRRAAEELDILILGPVPPPFGGISIHVSRLVSLLSTRGFSVGVLNHFRGTDQPFVLAALNRSPFRYYRVPRHFPARVVHYHHSRWPHLVAFAIGRGTRSRYILTLHAGDVRKHFPQLISIVPFVSRITRWSLSRFDVIITVDPSIAAAVREHTSARIEVIPAFISSAGSESERYEPELEEFLCDGRVLLVAAYGVQFMNGRELYGLDTVVEAFIALAPTREDARLAIFIARRPTERKARRHLEQLEQRLRDANVDARVRVVYGLPLLPAFRRNAIFMRPTRAEGDAVSVREARWAGVPVVASDVIARPTGVTTFAVGDASELRKALDSALDQPVQAREVASKPDTPSGPEAFSERLIQLYRDELSLLERDGDRMPREAEPHPGDAV
jgi:glycosyltransferase involved in cell wall biosynthesis